MRNYLVIAAMAIVTSASAQWQRKVVEADELRGTPRHVKEYYVGENWQFGLADSNGYYIAIENGIFDTERVKDYKGADVLVGLYDENGKITEKITMWLDYYQANIMRTRSGSYMGKPVGQDKKVKKIMRHLSEEKGYIRIIAPVYNNPDVDMKIPCKNE